MVPVTFAMVRSFSRSLRHSLSFHIQVSRMRPPQNPRSMSFAHHGQAFALTMSTGAFALIASASTACPAVRVPSQVAKNSAPAVALSSETENRW